VSSVQRYTSLAEYIEERRIAAGIPSAHALAKRAGVSPETVRQILIGSKRTPSERTLEKIAKAIGGSLPQMRLLAGEPAGEPEPFVLPPEANRLTLRQRQVVLSMISALLNTPDPSEGEDERSPEPVQLVGRRRRDTDGPT
jgi:Predicted transcriptional regulators